MCMCVYALACLYAYAYVSICVCLYPLLVALFSMCGLRANSDLFFPDVRILLLLLCRSLLVSALLAALQAVCSLESACV